MVETDITFVVADADMRNEGVEQGQEYTWDLDGETIEVVPTRIRGITFTDGRWQVSARLKMTRQHARILNEHSEPGHTNEPP